MLACAPALALALALCSLGFVRPTLARLASRDDEQAFVCFLLSTVSMLAALFLSACSHERASEPTWPRPRRVHSGVRPGHSPHVHCSEPSSGSGSVESESEFELLFGLKFGLGFKCANASVAMHRRGPHNSVRAQSQFGPTIHRLLKGSPIISVAPKELGPK